MLNKIDGPLASLNVLYESMPKTHGCEKCKEINGDNHDWCCKTQSPSMHYVEFLNVYKKVVGWNKQKKKALFLRAVRNYLNNKLNKGCIFYDNGCTIYSERPFVCRQYGVIPEENWNSRWEKLKEEQGDQFDAQPQCDLVTAERDIPAALEDRWFAHIQKCEERIGISKTKMHDRDGGTYRTFHDHLLLEEMDERFLEFLTKIRLSNPSEEDIELAINQLEGMFHGKISG